MPSESFFQDLTANQRIDHVFANSPYRVIGQRGAVVRVAAVAEGGATLSVQLGSRQILRNGRLGTAAVGTPPDLLRDTMVEGPGLPGEEIFVSVQDVSAAANEVRIKMEVMEP